MRFECNFERNSTAVPHRKHCLKAFKALHFYIFDTYLHSLKIHGAKKYWETILLPQYLEKYWAIVPIAPIAAPTFTCPIYIFYLFIYFQIASVIIIRYTIFKKTDDAT